MDYQNNVELIGHYGSDWTHACSAWTSTTRDLTDEKRERMPKLLDMLATQGHHTPFEKSCLHFLVNSDIASHIHKIKHRIAVSINAESARYKEIKDDNFYLPIDWPKAWRDELKRYTEEGLVLYHKCLDDLVRVHNFDKKRAKESARYFRTYNTQIECDVMFNFRSFFHFLKLRNKSDAQLEINLIAARMLELVKNIEGNPFEYTIKAFKL